MREDADLEALYRHAVQATHTAALRAIHELGKADALAAIRGNDTVTIPLRAPDAVTAKLMDLTPTPELVVDATPISENFGV